LTWFGCTYPEDRLTQLLTTREGLRVTVTVDAVRDVNRLLEGDERYERGKQSGLETTKNADMLEAQRYVLEPLRQF
jgi:hypothetical protein